MYIVGELADYKVAKEIIDLLKDRGLDATCRKHESLELYQVCVASQDHLILAMDLFRLKTGGPKTFTPPPEWKKIQGLPKGYLTLPVIFLCVAIYLLENFTSYGVYNLLKFSEDESLTELKNFQLWRLVTPCLMHFGFLHIFFNLMWWKDLSKIIEKSFGVIFLLLFCLLVGIASNIGQFLISGPGFGGLSGIIFGLFGLIWMLGRFHHNFIYKLPKNDVVLMVGWFVLCLTGALSFKIANMAHAIGISFGMIAGLLLSFLMHPHKRPEKLKQMILFFFLSLVFIFLGRF